jgi:hypothetical protein
MFLMELHERLKKQPASKLQHGFIGRIFEYNDKCAKDASGMLPVIVKLEPEEKKKRKSIN